MLVRPKSYGVMPRPWELSGGAWSPSKLRSDPASLGRSDAYLRVIPRPWEDLLHIYGDPASLGRSDAYLRRRCGVVGLFVLFNVWVDAGIIKCVLGAIAPSAVLHTIQTIFNLSDRDASRNIFQLY